MHPSNAQTLVEVTRDELPIHCPTPDSSLWNSHPRVFIPLHETPQASCMYCGTVFRLVDKKTDNPLSGDASASESSASDASAAISNP